MSAGYYFHAENCTVVKESAAALLIRFDPGEDVPETWVPKSLISEGDKYEVGDEGVTISIPGWKAEEIGLEGDGE